MNVEYLRERELQLLRNVERRINELGGACIVQQVGKIVLTNIPKQPPQLKYFYIQFDSFMIRNTYFTVPVARVSTSRVDLRKLKEEIDIVTKVFEGTDEFIEELKKVKKSEKIQSLQTSEQCQNI